MNTQAPESLRLLLEQAATISPATPAVTDSMRAALAAIEAHQPRPRRSCVPRPGGPATRRVLCSGCSRPPIEVTWPCGLLSVVEDQLRAAIGS